MFESLANILRMPDLRNRILLTLALLAVYRLGVYIPSPGVDRNALSDFFANSEGTLLNLYNMFSGGALQRFSVFVLGIMPYISASIIMQIGQIMFPFIERLKAQGQAGTKKINQYSRYLTIIIAVVQSFSISIGLEQMTTLSNQSVVLEPGWSFRWMTVITMTAGSCFVMWLGEQITERGIGQGASLIITAGIIAGIPSGANQLVQSMNLGQINLLEITMLLVFMAIVVGVIVFIERGQYKVPIQYAKKVVGKQVYGGQSTHLPLKMNVAGVLPPIFASSLMFFPGTIGQLFPNDFFRAVQSAFQPGSYTYMVTYVVLIVVFTFFYTAISFNPQDVADNLRRQGGYIPGVRPGKQTQEELDRILLRLTAGGAVYLAAVCILPEILAGFYGVPFYFGGTSLLIIVGVCMQTVAQIEGFMLTQKYDGLSGPQNSTNKGRRTTFQQKAVSNRNG